MGNDRYLQALIFAQIPKIGPILSRKLLELSGSLERLFDLSLSELKALEGFSEKTWEHIFKFIHQSHAKDRAKSEIDFLIKHKIRPIFIEDLDYPIRLKQCEDAPALIFLKGNFPLNANRIMAIVGTRKASPYGKKLTREFISQIKDFNIRIVSGLAYGIDIEAHQMALKMGIPNLGVLGHGLDQVYPSTHWEISQAMLHHGGLLAENFSGTPLSPGLFPKRNRIIAGLSDAVLVVEASEKGGAMITAQLANSYNREVFTFPGRVDDPYSRGCLKLVQDRQAELILGAEDFLLSMGWGNVK